MKDSIPCCLNVFRTTVLMGLCLSSSVGVGMYVVQSLYSVANFAKIASSFFKSCMRPGTFASGRTHLTTLPQSLSVIDVAPAALLAKLL